MSRCSISTVFHNQQNIWHTMCDFARLSDRFCVWRFNYPENANKHGPKNQSQDKNAARYSFTCDLRAAMDESF
jgi:hypothetical protein